MNADVKKSFLGEPRKEKSADAVWLSPPENVFMNMELKIAKNVAKTGFEARKPVDKPR